MSLTRMFKYPSSVVHVRETRISGILSHVFIGLSMFLLPEPLSYIPRPVLDGLFLYVAITALFGNQFFERILLLITEQVKHQDSVRLSGVGEWAWDE